MYIGDGESSGIKEVAFTGIPKGLNLDACRSNDDCRGDRSCYIWGGLSELAECSDQERCICISSHQLKCVDSSNCVDGEVCSHFSLFVVPICVSEVATNTFGNIQEFEPNGGGLDPNDSAVPSIDPQLTEEQKPTTEVPDGLDAGQSEHRIHQNSRQSKKKPKHALMLVLCNA